MKLAIRLLGASAGLAALALASVACAQDNQAIIDHGKRLAEANCAICHAIYPTGDSPLIIAPKFRDIAVSYDFADLEDAFNEGVATDHPAMPDWQMTPEQAEALASYIMSLSFAGTKKSDLETPPQTGMGFP